MAVLNESDLANKRAKRPRALYVLMSILLMVVCGGILWLLGTLIENALFTHPPGSVDKPPLLSNAQNVAVEQTDKPFQKVITYETVTDPDTVYTFYQDSLVKDGWGGQGYFSKPKLTDIGMVFEWDQLGINGCEGLGYVLSVSAEKTLSTTTSVRLVLNEINPC